MRRHLLCEMCNDRVSEELHHVVPLADGGELMDDGNVMALCVECHAEITAEWKRSFDISDDGTVVFK